MRNFLDQDTNFTHFCKIFHGMRLLFIKNPPDDLTLLRSKKYINDFLNEWPNHFNVALTYVIHSLEHLPDDCKFNKSTPDAFSAFPYESYLRRVKNNFHSGNKPLEQIYCRFAEELLIKGKHGFHKKETNSINCFKFVNETEFEMLKTPEFTVRLNKANNAIQYNDDVMIVEKNVSKRRKWDIFGGTLYKKELKRPLYVLEDTTSLEVGCFIIDLTEPGRLKNFELYLPMQDIKKMSKLVKIPMNDFPNTQVINYHYCINYH